MYSLTDREPVQVLKDGGDVVSGAGVGEEAGSAVLDILQFILNFG